MAPRLEDQEAPETHIISKGDFDKLLRKVKAAEVAMDEAKGKMGAAVDQAIADHNVHKEAFKIVRKYLKKDPTAAAEFITHLDAYWEHANLATAAADLVETPKERKSKAKAAAGDKLGKPGATIIDGKVVPIKEGVETAASASA